VTVARRVIVAGVALAIGRTAPAQSPVLRPSQPVPPASADRRVVPEARVDGFLASEPGGQIGGGVAVDAGTYMRLGVDLGVGFEHRSDGALVGVQRLEGVGRFHVDPFRQTSAGAYFGGGMAIRHEAGSHARALLVALIGLEGKPHRGVAAALEAGVGGGVRLGIVLRGARPGRR
jgi:hypothetical protein